MSGVGTTESTEQPFVSVVVPVFDAEETIGRMIDGILGQTYPRSKFEVVLVDNGSRDRTMEILERARDVHVVIESKRGASAARNAGIRAAKGEFIAFLDSDCVPDRSWLCNLMRKAASEPDAQFIGGRIRALAPRNEVERFGESLLDQRCAICEYKPPYAITANLLMRKDTLIRIGLFDPSLRRGQDVELSYRAYFKHGARFAYASDAVVDHANPRTLWQLFRKGMQHGDAEASVLRRFRHELKDTPVRRCFRAVRYRQIWSSLVESARVFFGKLRKKPSQDRRSPLCQAVFLSGKQVGLAATVLFRRSERSS